MDLQEGTELAHERTGEATSVDWRVDGPLEQRGAELPVTGSFSLRAAAEFGFGPDAGRTPPFDSKLRLAFAVDGGRGYAGAVLSQEAPPDLGQLTALAERWRPFRTWATVLIRLAGDRGTEISRHAAPQVGQ